MIRDASNHKVIAIPLTVYNCFPDAPNTEVWPGATGGAPTGAQGGAVGGYAPYTNPAMMGPSQSHLAPPHYTMGNHIDPMVMVCLSFRIIS